jgi:hypothetical protein
MSASLRLGGGLFQRLATMAGLVERSYLSMLLEADPEFYSRARDSARVEYEFSDGRKFLGREPYNYGPYLYGVEYLGELVYYNGEMVVYQSDVVLDV